MSSAAPVDGLIAGMGESSQNANMEQLLHASDPNQVSSPTVLDADLGVGNRHLLVISGIAITNWNLDTDDVVAGEVRVMLGVYARDLEQSSTFLGLASVANGESEFTFATEAARLDLDSATGELSLHVDTALQGEPSSLNRFSYQIVATVVRVGTFIDGTISWPTSLMKPPSNDPATVAPYLTAIANQYELLPGSGISPTIEKLTPLLPGAIESLTVGETQCDATYRIDNPPMAMPLKVTLAVAAQFAGVGFYTVRTSGPDNFILSPAQPSVTVDFWIGVQDIH